MIKYPECAILKKGRSAFIKPIHHRTALKKTIFNHFWVVVAVEYVVGLFLYEPLFKPWLSIGVATNVQFWLIAMPVFIGFVAILAIGAWIGFTMICMPPPKLAEEITEEDNTEALQTRTQPNP